MRLYILNEDDFRKTGSILNTASTPDDKRPVMADYGGGPLDTYCKENNAIAVDDKRFEELLEEFYQSMKSEFKPITEERYYDMLEVLPPMKWVQGRYNGMPCSTFFISEATTYTLHSCFGHINGKYFECMEDRFTKPEVLWAKLFKAYTNESSTSVQK